MSFRRPGSLHRELEVRPMTYRVVQWTTGNVGKQAVAGDRRPPGPRARGLLRMVRGQGRPRCRRAVRHRADRCARDERRRRAARAEAGLRRLHPDVDRRRRDGAHPGGREQHRQHRGVHHRPLARRRTAPDHRGVRAWRQLRLRERHQPGLRRPGRHRVRDRLRPHRQDHRHGVGRHHRLRLTRHGAARGLRAAHRRSRTCRR